MIAAHSDAGTARTRDRRRVRERAEFGYLTESRRTTLRDGNAPGSVYSPESPQCACWLMADVGISQVGGSVASWADQSANGRNFAQATATSQPTLAIGADGIGGKTALLFTSGASVAQYLRGPSFAALTTGAEMFLVLQVGNTTSATSILAFGSDPSNADFYYYLDGKIYTGFGTATRTGGQTSPGGASTVAQIYNVTSIAGSYVARLNGATIYTRASNTIGWLTDGSLLGGATASGSTSAVYGGFTGKIAAFLVYVGALSSTDRSTVGNGLATKYGTAAAW